MTGKESMLVVWDIGGTLAVPVGNADTLGQGLQRASPLPAGEVEAVYHRVLYTATMTAQVVEDVARRLRIDPSVIADYVCPAWQLCEGAAEVLEALAAIGLEMVALSNVSDADEVGIQWFRQTAGPWLDGVYTSYTLGAVKPDPRVFHHIAAKHGVETKNMIVVGDRAGVDLAGARAVGARGLLLTHEPLPEEYAGRPEEFTTARTLREALPMLLRWAQTGYRPPKPREHPLRAVAVLTNELDEVLLVHAPTDGPHWHFAGGGVTRGEPPHTSVERELAEELDINLVLDPDVAQWEWMPADERRQAHVVAAYPVTIPADTPIHRNDRELDDHRWVPLADAESLLFPGPAGDAALLAAVLRHTPVRPVIESTNVSGDDAIRVHTYPGPDKMTRRVHAAALIAKGQKYRWSADEIATAVVDALDPPHDDADRCSTVGVYGNPPQPPS